MQTERTVNQRENHQALSLHANKPCRVLIVDDDVDSALPLEDIFRNLGCETVCIVDMTQAQKAIESGRADIIILDWMLSTKLKADQLLQRSIDCIDRFATLKQLMSHHQIKIITYSSLIEEEIHVPPSQYFIHFDHWQKPIDYHSLVSKTLELLRKL